MLCTNVQTGENLGLQNKDTNFETRRNLGFQNECTEILKSLYDRKEGLYDGIFC